MDIYATSIVGILAICLTSTLLAIYTGVSKGMAGALAGPVLDARDDNRLYRIDRVHMNSVEALTPFVVPAVVAMLVGVSPVVLTTIVWFHFGIRLVYIAVYLRGGKAATGGNVRTALYLASALATIVLVCLTGWSAVT